MFPLLASLLIVVATRLEPDRNAGDLLWLFLLGVIAWTLLEYGLHRFVFHVPYQFRNPKTAEFVNASHLNHHSAPRDPDKLLVKPAYGLVISAFLFGITFAVTRSFFSTAGIMSGIWAGFLYYEAVHYRVHLTTAPSGFIARQRRAHFYHHFTNRERCFGVTSPLWDYVFKTQLPRPPR
jgi:sterol desaturase/sphingolipid hydroxylase (fatty acid hydroxylase superfamily)